MNISNQDYHIRMLADLAVVGSTVAVLSLITNTVKAVSMSLGLSPELICESIPSVIRKKEEKKK